MTLTGVKPESIALATEDKSAIDICTYVEYEDRSVTYNIIWKGRQTRIYYVDEYYLTNIQLKVY